jgi:hypothetical protein
VPSTPLVSDSHSSKTRPRFVSTASVNAATLGNLRLPAFLAPLKSQVRRHGWWSCELTATEARPVGELLRELEPSLR